MFEKHLKSRGNPLRRKLKCFEECKSFSVSPFKKVFLTSEWPSNQLTKTEALSGSQHVVLWLTRTSMSDLPSVPSLKNLVQASVFGSNSVRIKPHSKGSSSEKNSAIQRNFSTKSFLKYDREDDHAEPPLRKCETVIALSAMSSSSSTTSQKKAKKQPSSPLNVFKHLSNKVTKSSDNGSTTQGVTCESPYPVSLFLFHQIQNTYCMYLTGNDTKKSYAVNYFINDMFTMYFSPLCQPIFSSHFQMHQSDFFASFALLQSKILLQQKHKCCT